MASPLYVITEERKSAHAIALIQRKFQETIQALAETRDLAIHALRGTHHYRGSDTQAGPRPTFTSEDVAGYRAPDPAESISQVQVPGVPRPSCFCFDLIEMAGAVRQRMVEESTKPLDQQQRQVLDTLTQKMLVSLVTDKWQWAETWFWETVGLEKLAPITRYQISPTVENYWKIQPCWRPTPLQMSRFHWPALDWIPFPGIREKLILYANEIDLTDVILTTMQSYCLEVPDEDADTAMHSAGVDGPAVPARATSLYRLRDYIDHINLLHTSKDIATASGGRTRLSKSLEAKFVLTLGDIDAPFKLEQSFFDQFPLLFCEEAVGRGTFRSIYEAK